MSASEKLSFAELVLADNQAVLDHFADCAAESWLRNHFMITEFLRARLAYQLSNGPLGPVRAVLFGYLISGFTAQAEDRIGHGYSSDPEVREWLALNRFVQEASRITLESQFANRPMNRVRVCMELLLAVLEHAGVKNPIRFENMVKHFGKHDQTFSREEVAKTFMYLAQHPNVRTVRVRDKSALLYIPDPGF
jgi:hypothetical protein